MEAHPQLKCQLQGHEQNKLIYICTDVSCKFPEKLLCTKCAIEHGHSKNFLLIDEFVDQKNISNWPNDLYGKKISNLLSWCDIDHAFTVIDDLFDFLQCEILKKLEFIKADIKEKFENQTSKLQTAAEELSQAYDEGYGLQELQNLIFEYVKDNLSNEQINQAVKEFFANTERSKAAERAQTEFAKLAPKCKYYIDQQYFKDSAIRDILSKLDSLEAAFSIGYSQVDWRFENSLLYQSENLIEISPGVIFQPGGINDEEVLFSDREFTKGVHGYRIRFDEVSDNYRCHILLGLFTLNKKQEVFNPYMCIMCCEHMQNMACKLNKKFSINKGSIVDVQADFDQDLFTITEVSTGGKEQAAIIWKSTLQHSQSTVLGQSNNALQIKKKNQQQQTMAVSNNVSGIHLQQNSEIKKKFFIFFSCCGPNRISLQASY